MDEMKDNIKDNRDVLLGIARRARLLHDENDEPSIKSEPVSNYDESVYNDSVATSTRFDFDQEVIASRSYQRALVYLQKIDNRQTEFEGKVDSLPQRPPDPKVRPDDASDNTLVLTTRDRSASLENGLYGRNYASQDESRTVPSKLLNALDRSDLNHNKANDQKDKCFPKSSYTSKHRSTSQVPSATPFSSTTRGSQLAHANGRAYKSHIGLERSFGTNRNSLNLPTPIQFLPSSPQSMYSSVPIGTRGSQPQSSSGSDPTDLSSRPALDDVLQTGLREDDIVQNASSANKYVERKQAKETAKETAKDITDEDALSSTLYADKNLSEPMFSAYLLSADLPNSDWATTDSRTPPRLDSSFAQSDGNDCTKVVSSGRTVKRKPYRPKEHTYESYNALVEDLYWSQPFVRKYYQAQGCNRRKIFFTSDRGNMFKYAIYRAAIMEGNDIYRSNMGFRVEVDSIKFELKLSKKPQHEGVHSSRPHREVVGDDVVVIGYHIDSPDPINERVRNVTQCMILHRH